MVHRVNLVYLSDKDLHAKIHELAFETDNPNHCFIPEDQIQPSSIDLRLSNVFWEPKKVRAIDIRKSALLELSPRRYWERIVLAQYECITLKPGKLLLGRTYEKFSVPLDCAAKIEGRSSFSRMGIGIHCTGDYINPGYRGHMPIELYNYSPNPIKIFPYIPICQLIIIKLSGVPDRQYGTQELQSKYMDDDGGPSYWWRDKRIKELQQIFHERSIDLNVQEQILTKIGVQNPEIIERFEELVYKIPDAQKENAETLLSTFTQSEDKLKSRDKVVSRLSLTFFPLLLSVVIGASFTQQIGIPYYLTLSTTFVSFWPFYNALTDTSIQYLGTHELKQLEDKNV